MTKKHQVSRLTFFTAMILAATLLSACVPNLGSSQNVPVEGEFIAGGAVRGFPNLPLYEKAQIIETFGSKEGYGGSFLSGDSISKVVEFYNEALPVLGWQTNLSSQNSNYFVFDIKNNQYVGSVIINNASDGKKTAITMSVAVR